MRFICEFPHQVHNSNWLEAPMREVVLVSSVRTPVGRAYKGTLRATRPDELAAIAIKGALDRVPQLDPNEIEDVILGCAMPEAEQGMNVARLVFVHGTDSRTSGAAFWHYPRSSG